MSGISVYRGDSKNLRTTVAHQNGTPYDLTDMRVILTVKRDQDSEEVTLQKVAEPQGDGICLFKLSPRDTSIAPGQYPYDIELSNLDRSFVATLVVGRFTVQNDVGRGVQ